MKPLYASLFAICLLFLLSLTAAGADGGVRVTVNGQELMADAYLHNGVTMAPLRALAEALGCTVTWDAASRTAVITSPHAPAEPLVVLDPGHGGKSTGAQYGGVYEKDLNLAIARAARPLLEAEGVRVALTRESDQDVGLYQRTEFAGALKADLFVSIHCNASVTNPSAAGIYTAAFGEQLPGWQLAETLRQAMMEATGAADMGTEARPELAVLRTAAMPAALVECGYMSTPGELALLTQPAYQEQLARGIAQGILAHLDTTWEHRP